MIPSAIFAIQVVILLICIAIIWHVISRFPYPSALIRPFLPPQLRWPEAQIRRWIDAGRIDRRFLAYFSRDPEREIPPGEQLLAPADGVVNDIFDKDGMTYVVIALSFWDVHVQRSPVAGTITGIRRTGDSYMDWEWQDAAFLRDKRCPVQAVIGIKTPFGAVEVRLITSYAARRINVYPCEGDTVARGQRLGNITFGSTVVMAVPSSAAILVEIGARVSAGETLVADPPEALSRDAVAAVAEGKAS